ncbi:MAG: hypothetical protein ACRD15_03320 [Vicinamibacterales bacterium]
METPSKVFAGARRPAGAIGGASPAADDLRGAQGAHEDLLQVALPRVNLLLTGKGRVIQNVLNSLVGKLDQPIASWCPGEQLVLPPAERAGTMVLHEIGALDLQDQIRLLEWTGLSMGRTQVVSTTAAPLLPRVEAGAFIDTLYYRLNMVCVDVTD